MRRNPRAQERVLLYSLWGLLFLGFALWKLRSPATEFVAIPVTLAPELSPWFGEATVVGIRGGNATLHLSLTPHYRTSLKGTPSVNVKYRLQTEPPAEGRATVRLRPDRSAGTLQLPLPSPQTTRRIELYLHDPPPGGVR